MEVFTRNRIEWSVSQQKTVSVFVSFLLHWNGFDRIRNCSFSLKSFFHIPSINWWMKSGYIICYRCCCCSFAHWTEKKFYLKDIPIFAFTVTIFHFVKFNSLHALFLFFSQFYNWICIFNQKKSVYSIAMQANNVKQQWFCICFSC